MSFKVLVRFCFHYYREKKAVALYNDMRQAGRSKSKNKKIVVSFIGLRCNSCVDLAIL